MKERKCGNDSEIPMMCSRCKGFLARSSKARHQLICPAAGCNLMLPMVNVASLDHLENISDGFKEVLNTLLLVEVGNYNKIDEIILMFGMRSFSALKRRQDKITEGRKAVRAFMRQTHEYTSDLLTSIRSSRRYKWLIDTTMWQMEAITILGNTVNVISENPDDVQDLSISGQKTGLRISILNLLKLMVKFLIGHFLVKGSDERAKRVTLELQQ